MSRVRLAQILRQRTAAFNQYPMSHQQQGLWFLENLYPDSGAYHVPLCWEHAPRRDPGLLREALRRLILRHPALRTAFGLDPVELAPVQTVHRAVEIPFAHTDLSALPADEAMARAARLGEEHTQAPFDLEAGPLLRAAVIDLPGGTQRLLLTLHHLIADGWSLNLLAQDLEALYTSLSLGGAPPPDPPATSYHDWSCWQRENRPGRWRDHLAYYRAALADQPPCLELPTDRPRPARPSHRAGLVKLTVAPDVAAALGTRARSAETTLFAVLLTALGLVLHRRSGQRRFAIGTPVANRVHPAVFDVVGYFVNTAVVPFDCTPGEPADALLARVHRAFVSALEYQDLPFERLVEELSPPRSLSTHPLFQVMLAFQNTPEAWEAEQLRRPGTSAKFDLTFNAVEAPDGLRLECVYAADLFDSGSVEKICDEFAGTLEAMAFGPGPETGKGLT